MDTNNVETNEEELAADTMFESFFDSGSGVWSLRRVSTPPPQGDDADLI